MMEVLIVDDELLARQRLARMLAKLDNVNLVGEAENADDALTAIAELDPDVVLLDIQMPECDGLTLAQKIAELEDPPSIIFCTAYDQYALDAFGTTAIGYLLKPVKPEALLAVLEKASKLNKIQRATVQAERPLSREQRTHISAKTRRGVELIPLDDVRFFLADHKYVTAMHRGGEHLLDETLKELEEEFGGRFVRIHRNALVSIQHIEALERNSQGQYQVRLADVETRPAVSRRHVTQLKELLNSI